LVGEGEGGEGKDQGSGEGVLDASLSGLVDSVRGVWITVVILQDTIPLSVHRIEAHDNSCCTEIILDTRYRSQSRINKQCIYTICSAMRQSRRDLPSTLTSSSMN